MENPPLRTPSFGYRSASTWATGIMIAGPLITLALLAPLSNSIERSAANALGIAGIALSFLIPLSIYVAARYWATRGEPYVAFQRAVHDWAVQNYQLWLNPSQLRRLTQPTPKRANVFLPPDREGAPVHFGREQGWYTGLPIKLEGDESSAPALAGRRLSVTLVINGERLLLVTVPFGVPLPRGQGLAIPFHRDEAYVPYSTASIAGLIVGGVAAWLALWALAVLVLGVVDPAAFQGPPREVGLIGGRVIPFFALLPVLPLFHAAGRRARENARHR